MPKVHACLTLKEPGSLPWIEKLAALVFKARNQPVAGPRLFGPDDLNLVDQRSNPFSFPFRRILAHQGHHGRDMHLVEPHQDENKIYRILRIYFGGVESITSAPRNRSRSASCKRGIAVPAII